MSDDQPKKSKRSKDVASAADAQPETQPEQPAADGGTMPSPAPDAPAPDASMSVASAEPIVVPTSNVKGLYGKGYRRDKHDTSKDLTIRHLLGARVGQSPPEVANMEPLVSGVMGVKDQGQTGRCVAFAMARCAQIRCAITNVPLKEFSSTNCLYTVGRAKERANEGFVPADKPLVDEGSIPQCVVDGANDWGVCSETQWPSTLDDLNQEPSPDKLMSASQFKVSGYYRISTTGAQRVEDVKQALAAGFPVLIGVQVDPAFEAYSGGMSEPAQGIPNAVTKPDLTQDLGGHALCLLGYKTFAGGVLLMRGVNSWGESWGDYGFFWADVTWLCDDSVMDILVITFDPSHHAVAA